MSACPCKGCLSREVGCHATCEAYSAWSARRAAIAANATKERIAYNMDRKHMYDTTHPTGNDKRRRYKHM